MIECHALPSDDGHGPVSTYYTGSSAWTGSRTTQAPTSRFLDSVRRGTYISQPLIRIMAAELLDYREGRLPVREPEPGGDDDYAAAQDFAWGGA